MRPTPEEIIRSARTLLREHIAPKIDSDAQQVLRRVMSALRDARWNDAAFDLLHENAELAALLRSVADASKAQRPSIAERLVEAAENHAAIGTPRSFDAANSMNHTLRRALTELIEAMRDEPISGDEQLGMAIAHAMRRLQEPAQ